jgi:hypothetical protein
MLGSARTVPTLLGHSLFAVSVCSVTAAALRVSLQVWTGGGRTGRRLDAVGRGSLGASWRRAFAALGLRPSFAPSSVLARTWSGLSASSPTGAASVIEFSRFVALVPASSLPIKAPASRGSGGPLPSLDGGSIKTESQQRMQVKICEMRTYGKND